MISSAEPATLPDMADPDYLPPDDDDLEPDDPPDQDADESESPELVPTEDD